MTEDGLENERVISGDGLWLRLETADDWRRLMTGDG